MTEKEIYDSLIKAGLTPEGAAGLMGNLQAESGLRPNNLQNSFNKKLLACHIRSCVAEDIKAGKEESVDELVHVLQKLMK